jgi:hypothetical protein
VSFWSRIFGCRHKKLGDPFTPRRAQGYAQHPAAALTGTYRVCLDCGKEFSYSLESMSIVYPCRSKHRKETAMRAEQ